MSPVALSLIFNIALGLLIFVVWLLILWAIIRGAVLSALRKHSSEQRELSRM